MPHGTNTYSIWDGIGKPFAMKYSNDGGNSFTTYYYVLNLQGDVVMMLDQDGNVVAEYAYTAWGQLRRASGRMAFTNPLRYRGYYYDSETGFYYLQSRYYDPSLHRFINADAYASTGQSFIGTNMFAYCNNNPVTQKDASGNIPNHCVMLTDTGGSGRNTDYGKNVYNMMQFFGVNSPEEIPDLPDGAMVFIENISSESFGFVSCIVGRTIVMDNEKYCEYVFTGTGLGISGIVYDTMITAGYVYGVNDPQDYSGIFVGDNVNMIYGGNGKAVAPNGVVADILGVRGYLSPSLGISATGYTALSNTWIYDLAPINWYTDSHPPFSYPNRSSIYLSR